MAWLKQEALEALNFRHLGRNVKISDKASIYDAELMSIGDNSRIDDFCVVSGRVTIGRNVHIAVFCNVAGGEEGIEMCDFSGLAYSCNIFTQSDDYTGGTMTNPTVPDAYKLESKKAVRLGRHCIVGTNSIVFPGVDMKDGCALGAMAMLTRSTEPWGIYSGVPARRVRDRKQDLLTLEARYLTE
jgi:galactoside O-acetyltransferase